MRGWLFCPVTVQKPHGAAVADECFDGCCRLTHEPRTVASDYLISRFFFESPPKLPIQLSPATVVRRELSETDELTQPRPRLMSEGRW